jgi:hypothetical protein
VVGEDLSDGLAGGMFSGGCEILMWDTYKMWSRRRASAPYQSRVPFGVLRRMFGRGGAVLLLVILMVR